MAKISLDPCRFDSTDTSKKCLLTLLENISNRPLTFGLTAVADLRTYSGAAAIGEAYRWNHRYESCTDVST